MSSQSWPKYPVAHASLDTLTTCTKHTDHTVSSLRAQPVAVPGPRQPYHNGPAKFV